MKVVLCEILQSRAGAVTYNAGDTVPLPYAKAINAQMNGWARIVEKGDVKQPEPKPVAAKMVAPPTVKAAPSPTPLATIKGVLQHFSGNADAMRAYAEKEGIYIPGRTKKAKTIAKYIAEHYA